MKNIYYIFLTLIAFTCITSCTTSETTNGILVSTPPLGWNSYDSYGLYINEKQTMENLEAFNEKLKPFGYKYFVLDSGWFIEYDSINDGYFDKDKLYRKVHINEYGLLQPSKSFFPNGFKPIIERCHELGIKFGLHLMRGIPKSVVAANLPIKGTDYKAQDIANLTDTCTWSTLNYGIDVTKPGGQEFYDALIGQLADWGVDFIKYDDIVPHPDEVNAVIKAIEKSGRDITLSLSPGDEVPLEGLDFFRKANMLRVTGDVWDNQNDIDKCFDAWKKWQGMAQPGFWTDMDMVPFGQLQVNCPKPLNATGKETKDEVRHKIRNGEFGFTYPYCGTGWKRESLLSKEQMRTFIVLRAMSASPIFIGGDLPTMDDYSLYLLTNKDILSCNQSGIMGKLILESEQYEIWKNEISDKNGYIGIFNRSDNELSLNIKLTDLNINDNNSTKLYDIFNDKIIQTDHSTIKARDVLFIKYSL